jgi:hypothetical protein
MPKTEQPATSRFEQQRRKSVSRSSQGKISLQTVSELVNQRRDGSPLNRRKAAFQSR